MTSTPNVRRVLADRDANSPITRIPNLSAKAMANSPTKPQKMVEISLQSCKSPALSARALEESKSERAKRGAIFDEIHSERSTKRQKNNQDRQVLDNKSEVVAYKSVVIERSHRDQEEDVDRVPDLEPTSDRIGSSSPDQVHDEEVSLASTSPSSSQTQCRTVELNDSVNTILTEPDHDPIAHERSTTSQLPSLTSIELAEKAKELKSRLRLASYKIRTNQMDIPFERLEIRSSSISSRASRPAPQHPTLSNDASNIPRINLHRPSSGKGEELCAISSSPPAACHRGYGYISPAKDNRELLETFRTPTNASHLGSPIWADGGSVANDLTSSVVRGRAADSLLSLKRL